MATDHYPTPVLHALRLLRDNPQFLDDARQGSIANNSIAGSVLALTLDVPRQYAEQAVREAVEIIRGDRS